MDVEKFISLIKSHPILYDRNQRGYQNLTKKAKIWETIAKEMNESSDVLRTKWKGLKDSYTKYQKQSEDLTGDKSTNCSRYHKWCWAEHLQFLDKCGKRSKSSRSKINTASLYDCSLEELPPSTQRVTTSPGTIQLEIEPGFLESLETSSKDIVPESRPTTSIQTTSVIESSRLIEPSHNRSSKRSHSASADGDETRDKLAEATDHLFKSYAETFKSFSAKRQVSLKVQLAKLFADAEMDEINESSVTFSSALGLELETMKQSPESFRSSTD